MPKRTFLPASGVSFAKFSEIKPKFTETPSSSFTRAQKEGLRYEKKAHEYLKGLVSSEIIRELKLILSPWIMFTTNFDPKGRIRFCQPDAIVLSKDERRIILFEIKYQHTNEAFKQLRLLYEPVLKFMYPLAEIFCVEICRWFDPHSFFEEHYHFLEHPLFIDKKSLGVHIFHPRKK